MVVFKYTFDPCSDRNRLHRISQQVSYHAYAISKRNFDQHGDVGQMLPKCRMGGMPDALPTEDPPSRLDLGPFGIKGMAVMADPLRPELPRVTADAALNQKTVLA